MSFADRNCKTLPFPVAVRRAYQKPSLSCFGAVAGFTAGGSGATQEGVSVKSGGKTCGTNKAKFC